MVVHRPRRPSSGLLIVAALPIGEGEGGRGRCIAHDEGEANPIANLLTFEPNADDVPYRGYAVGSRGHEPDKGIDVIRAHVGGAPRRRLVFSFAQCLGGAISDPLPDEVYEGAHLEREILPGCV